MKLNNCLLSLVATAALPVSEAQLRPSISGEGSSSRRELFGFLNMDNVMDAFLPVLTGVIENTIDSNLNNVDLRMDFQQDLANLDVTPNCTTSALVDYKLGMLRGLEGFSIDSVELVPGSDSLDLSFFGFNGASWSGIWNIRGRFEGIVEVASEAMLQADACGVPMEETSSGQVLVENPGLDLRIAMDGSSPSIFNLASAVADSITVEDARFSFDTILPVIDGLFGNDLELDLSTIFEGLFSDAFLNQMLPLLLELLQNVLQNGLPF